MAESIDDQLAGLSWPDSPEPAPQEEEAVQMSWPDPEKGPWSVRVHWRDIAGRPECIGLELWHGTMVDGAPLLGADAMPITSTSLRDLKPDALIRAARARRVGALGSAVDTLHARMASENKAAGRGRTQESPFNQPTSKPSAGEAGAPASAHLRSRAKRMGKSKPWPTRSKTRGRPTKHTPEHWAEVAEVYKNALARGWDPTAEVSVHFVGPTGEPIAYSTAATWVNRCRSKGLLPPTPKGKAGA